MSQFASEFLVHAADVEVRVVWQFSLSVIYMNNKGKVNKKLPLLTPMSNEYLICPYDLIPESNFKVMRIKEMITKLRSSWFLNKSPLSAPQEM